MLRSLLALLLPLLLIALPAHALDTSAGVGLQDRALFQETVDYTLTNQSNGDFHGQNLANTSFAGAVGRGADFRDANLHGAILTQGAFAEADFRGADLSDALMDRADFVATDLRGAILSGVIASGSSFSVGCEAQGGSGPGPGSGPGSSDTDFFYAATNSCSGSNLHAGDADYVDAAAH